MMHERGTSDPVIVAMKLTNKAERSAAEPVERRAGTKGNVNQQSTPRTPSRISVTKALERMRQDLPPIPEVGAVCGKAARTDLCGGRSAMSVPTATAALAMTTWMQLCMRESDWLGGISAQNIPLALNALQTCCISVSSATMSSMIVVRPFAAKSFSFAPISA